MQTLEVQVPSPLQSSVIPMAWTRTTRFPRTNKKGATRRCPILAEQGPSTLGSFQHWLGGWVLLISAQAGSAREDNRVGGDCLAELTLLTVGGSRWECSLGRRCSQNQKYNYGAGAKLVFPAVSQRLRQHPWRTARKSHSGSCGLCRAESPPCSCSWERQCWQLLFIVRVGHFLLFMSLLCLLPEPLGVRTVPLLRSPYS